MPTQSEAELENDLIAQLATLGYSRVTIHSDAELRANLRQQLSAFNAPALNGTPLTEGEFAKVLNHLNKGNVFARAQTLRDRYQLTRDDGTAAYVRFFDSEQWCQNLFQVTNQVTMKGRYKNRYDVTLLINGLPLVQIELKRRGVELKEAFNQVNRYQRHSFSAGSGLFQYVQIFVISNGVNTKYYANNRKQSFKQTFFWADVANKKVSRLEPFANHFLEKCHLSKMIGRYIVLHQSDKILMVLRPYQYHAVEAIIERVKARIPLRSPGETTQSSKNGYIWHTTGSGKTLTSFKAAQILTAQPDVHKVLFVVDRADLDYQTTKEFNYFSEGSVDGTDNTKALVKQLGDLDTNLIVTTIQKLNTAIGKRRYEKAITGLRDKRIVFIFDECHRSQFGDTHKRITRYFTNAQLFGFTGTPIFANNAIRNDHGKRTTADLFDKCLHRYVITNAIADDNVLRFSVEYWGKPKRKDSSFVDEQVKGINRKAFFESSQRIEQITDWVIAHHKRKTHNRKFSAAMCVGSVDALTAYYDTFQRKKEEGLHDLRIATIFTFQPNEEDEDANGLLGDPDPSAPPKHSRDKLAAYISHYNDMFGTNESVKDGKAFYSYYRQVAKRMKSRDRADFVPGEGIDILLVVNMFLTGFDAKTLNTLYVDKNLKHHGLIQAFSRTNRTLGSVKSQGNIVCFRNLKAHTDAAIALFSDENAQETILLEPYEVYVERFNAWYKTLSGITAEPDAVDELISEDDQLEFIQRFRNLMRTLNVLRTFTEFTWDDLDQDAQVFEEFKSKYLDLYQRSRNAQDDSASIIDEIDFELELIARDEINVAYILQLLQTLHEDQQDAEASAQQYAESKAKILALLGQEVQLRSKRALIERFINEMMPKLDTGAEVEEAFAAYWSAEQEAALTALCQTEDLNREKVDALISRYRFTNKPMERRAVLKALNFKPKVLQRKKIYTRVSTALMDLIHTFDDDMGGA